MSRRVTGSQVIGRCRRIRLDRIAEQRGSLCVVEAGQQLPFEIERAYWIFDVPSRGERGGHGHREQSEFLVAIRGSFVVRCDDGLTQSVHRLDSPDEGLLLPPMVFHRLTDFAPQSVCLVLASGPYDASEYVHDHDEFRKLIVEG